MRCGGVALQLADSLCPWCKASTNGYRPKLGFFDDQHVQERQRTGDKIVNGDQGMAYMYRSVYFVSSASHLVKLGILLRMFFIISAKCRIRLVVFENRNGDKETILYMHAAQHEKNHYDRQLTAKWGKIIRKNIWKQDLSI